MDNLFLNVNDIFIEMINIQIDKENKNNIWNDSIYKDIIKLQCNNVGNVGETFIQQICSYCDITSDINGLKTKGGGIGDGIINNKSVEIKTSYRGSIYPTFQHELGETPWKAEIILFIDIAPDCIYITIFNNFTEEFYKSGNKCIPYFPSKSITWRKGSGAFKLDTTIKINEENIINGYTFKITKDVNVNELKKFIISNIK